MELLFAKYFFGYRRAADTRVGKKDWVNFSFCFPIISQLQKGMIFSENTTLKVCLSGEETGFRNREVTNQCSQSSHETYHHDRKVNIHTSIYPRSLDVSCPTLETRPVLEKTFLFSRRPKKHVFLEEIRTLKKRDLFLICHAFRSLSDEKTASEHAVCRNENVSPTDDFLKHLCPIEENIPHKIQAFLQFNRILIGFM